MKLKLLLMLCFDGIKNFELSIFFLSFIGEPLVDPKLLCSEKFGGMCKKQSLTKSGTFTDMCRISNVTSAAHS